jgi:hypothetical protein
MWLFGADHEQKEEENQKKERRRKPWRDYVEWGWSDRAGAR